MSAMTAATETGTNNTIGGCEEDMQGVSTTMTAASLAPTSLQPLLEPTRPERYVFPFSEVRLVFRRSDENSTSWAGLTRAVRLTERNTHDGDIIA